MRFPRELLFAATLTLVSSVGAAPEGKGSPPPEALPQTGAADTDLAARLQRAELLAGLTDVEGSGLVVHLRHSPRDLKGVDRETLAIHDQDVNAVLNALRIGGAEALAIADGRKTVVERILVLSAAAAKGDGIVVNGTYFTAPYRIFALGDPFSMRAELLREGGVIKKAALDTLQMVELETAAALRIPASRNEVGFKFVRTQTPTVVAVVPRAQPVPPEASPRRSLSALAVGEGSPAPLPVPPGRAEKEKPRPLPADSPTGSVPVVDRGPAAPAVPEAVKPPAPRAPAPLTTPMIPVYFGGKDLAKFHVAGCRFGERIDKPRRMLFASPEAARKAGRAPCKICLVELTRG